MICVSLEETLLIFPQVDLVYSHTMGLLATICSAITFLKSIVNTKYVFCSDVAYQSCVVGS